MKKLFISLLAVATWGYASAQNTDHSDKNKQSTSTTADTSVSKFLIKAMKSSAMEIEAGQLAQQRAQSADVKAYGARMVTDHTNATNELRPIALKRNIDLSMAMSERSTGTNISGTNSQTGNAAAAGTTTATSSGNNQSASSAGTTATSGNTSTATNTNVNYDSNTSAGKATTDTSRKASHQEKLNLLKQKSGAEFDREYMTMMVKDHTKAVKLFENASTHSDAEIKAFATKTLPLLRDHLSSAQTILSSLASTNNSGKQ